MADGIFRAFAPFPGGSARWITTDPAGDIARDSFFGTPPSGGVGATPAYVNAGIRQNNASATSRTPALPSPLTNGEILICVCGSANTATHTIGGGGWQSFFPQTNSGTAFTCSFWWRVVDGTEASPTISWTGAAACWAHVFNFSRDNYDTLAPFGALGVASTGTGTTATAAGITTTRDNSLAVYMVVSNVNTAMSTPTGGWTERVDTGSSTSGTRNALGDLSLPTSGTASGSISSTIGSSDWLALQFELLAAQSGGGGSLLKVWSGSAWAEKPAKVWTGSAWVGKPAKVWNGSAWI
jgi:hypothetical protein